MYTERNFRTKKALTEAFEAGHTIDVYQPGPFGGDRLPQGAVYLEGPHYPEPHKWYASGMAKDGQLVSLKGSKAKWLDGKFIPAPPKVKVVRDGEAIVTTRSHVDWRTE